MVIILIFVVLIGLFFFFSIKYRNNHTLTFVFGKKGSGKTCLMVREIIKHAKKGWTIYTDIPINYPGIRIIQPKDIGKYVPEPHSLLCLDEVGLTYNNRNYKNNFTSEQLEFWKLQRHFHVKCIMASQSWDADIKLRQLTDRMILQSNIGNCISVSRPIYRGVTLTEPTSEGEARIADTLKFAPIWHWKFYWMPRYFKYFDSFQTPARPFIPYVLKDLKDMTSRDVLQQIKTHSSIGASETITFEQK